MLRYILIAVVVLSVLSCTKDVTFEDNQLESSLKRQISSFSPSGSYDFYVLPDYGDLDNIPQDVLNPLTLEKVSLGRMLFFETGLAMDANRAEGVGTYSCATCHIPSAGFKPGGPQGVADGGLGYGVNGESRRKFQEYDEADLDVQSARPMSLVNVAFVTNTFWNGQFGSGGGNIGTEDIWEFDEATARNALGYEAIETQNFDGVVTHRMRADKELLDEYGYTEMFDHVFPDVAVEERYSQFTLSLALSAYIRSIVSDRAPFQDWLKGDPEAMTLQEKEGAALFFGKARCANCHYEKNLGSGELHALGVQDMYQRPSFDASEDDKRNLGRGGFTLKEEDNYKFRVPQLYNVGDAPFYFHGASKATLEEVIDYKSEAVSENYKVDDQILSEKFLPIDLSQEEKDNLLQFLRVSLRDPNLDRYMPNDILSGFCFPNNDYQSQLDLGCN